MRMGREHVPDSIACTRNKTSTFCSWGLWARPPVLSLVPLPANHNPQKNTGQKLPFKSKKTHSLTLLLQMLRTHTTGGTHFLLCHVVNNSHYLPTPSVCAFASIIHVFFVSTTFVGSGHNPSVISAYPCFFARLSNASLLTTRPPVTSPGHVFFGSSCCCLATL